MQKKRLFHYFGKVSLIILILLNVLEFFELLSGDLSYVKVIISWTMLGYLIYHVSITKLFFNNKNKWIDITLIVSYFLLIIKNLILFSSASIEEFVFFSDFNNFLLLNESTIEYISFLLGLILITVISLYSAKYLGIKKSSLLNVLVKEDKKHPRIYLIKKFLIVYFTFFAFFIIIFNLVMEWFAIAIDSPLVMIAVLFYFFVIIEHYKDYDKDNIIYKIGEPGDKYFEKFLELFHDKKSIFIGLSGMLVLHLVTDAISFIIPYVFDIKESLYFKELGLGHEPLMQLFLGQISRMPYSEQVFLFLVYIVNIFGIFFLLLLPFMFFLLIFTKKKIRMRNAFMAFALSCIFILIISPVFQIKRINANSVVRVDIQTKFSTNYLFNSYFKLIFFIFLIFILIYLLGWSFRHVLLFAIIFISHVFFTYYVYLFFTSLLIYYSNVIVKFYTGKKFIFLFYFVIFLAINILFYIIGFIMYIDELIKEKVFKKVI